MARMSIDDMILRDPRVLRLAKLCGWTRRYTIGALLDVYAVAYDRVSAVLDAIDVDIAAELEGFAANMIEVGLGTQTRDGVRISGAEKRLEYLRSRETSGREGGLKSGETRRKRAKQTTKVDAKVTFDKIEGRVNPLVPDPVSVPDPVPDPKISDHSLPRAIPPSTVVAPEQAPAPLVTKLEAQDRKRLAESTWARVSAARVEIAKEIGLAALPLPASGPACGSQAFRELLTRIREEGDEAIAVCDRVFEVLVAQARDTRSVDWLSEKAFTEGGWRTARSSIPGWRQPSRAGPRAAIGAATPRTDHPESADLIPMRELV